MKTSRYKKEVRPPILPCALCALIVIIEVVGALVLYEERYEIAFALLTALFAGASIAEFIREYIEKVEVRKEKSEDGERNVKK